MPKNKTLVIHSISNSHYNRLKSMSPITGPQLMAYGTGVPTLRAYALGLPATSMLKNVDDFIRHRFTAFMTGLQLWAGRSSVKGRARLLKIIKEPQEVCQNVAPYGSSTYAS